MICVIPARAGKNLQLVGGVPLVLRTAYAVQEADCRPIVSTNCKHVMDVCNKAKIDYVKRPKSLSTDTSVTQDAVAHVIKKLKLTDDYIGMLQCTTPFTTKTDITLCALAAYGYSWALTVTETTQFVMADKTIVPEKWDRRQDMPKYYNITGGVYFYKVSELHRWRELYYRPEETAKVVVEKLRGLDINEKEDTEYANYLCQRIPDLSTCWGADHIKTESEIRRFQSP